MIVKFDKYINESIRDMMKPKPREEVEKATTELKRGGMVNEYKEIIGKVLTNVEEIDNIAIDFIFEDGSIYSMYNEEEGSGNDCRITLEDVYGEWNDIIGEPLTMAEEVINNTSSGSGTWTFYKFATIKGYVDLRWYGVSNGYYSESVSFRKIN